MRKISEFRRRICLSAGVEQLFISGNVWFALSEVGLHVHILNLNLLNAFFFLLLRA